MLSADGRASWRGNQPTLHATVRTTPGTFVADELKTEYQRLELGLDFERQQAQGLARDGVFVGERRLRRRDGRTIWPLTELPLEDRIAAVKQFQDRMYDQALSLKLGGLGSVRGFDQGTLGPRDVTGASLGGPKKVTLNAELIAPFPGAGNDRTLRVFTFFDVGNVYGENEKVTFSDMRSSVGLGLSWISPLGPLRLAFAQPVRKFAGDRIQKLQFQIGTSF